MIPSMIRQRTAMETKIKDNTFRPFALRFMTMKLISNPIILTADKMGSATNNGQSASMLQLTITSTNVEMIQAAKT